MRDPDGVEWLTLAQAHERWPRLNPPLIRLWISRGRIRSHLIDRRRWVHAGDLLEAERQARRAEWRRGRRSKGI